jgi:hypothetical protein
VTKAQIYIFKDVLYRNLVVDQSEYKLIEVEPKWITVRQNYPVDLLTLQKVKMMIRIEVISHLGFRLFQTVHHRHHQHPVNQNL